MRFHGIVYKKDSEGHSGLVRFGFLRLLHLLNGYFCTPKSSPEERRPLWSDKCFDRRFGQAMKAFQDRFWKIDRVATLLNRTIEKIETKKDSRKIEDAAQFNTALIDVQIYLDSMMQYLRSQAGCISTLLPYFYGGKGMASFPGSGYQDNFRKQKDWFLTKKEGQKLDKEYSNILSKKLAWFDTLSGEKSGLREIITHYRGVYQIGWSGDDRKPFDLRVALVNETGFVSGHLIPEILKLIAGYYDYLESIYEHYFKMMEKKFGKEFFKDAEKLSTYYTFDKTPNSSWIYPVIAVD